MQPERWKEIDQILQQALSRPPESLASFLEEACGGDKDLRREVESLLEHERKAGDLFASPAQAEKSAPDLVGRSLLHYRIVEKIGEGGMGVVYRALDTHLNRPVAVKMLPPGRMADPERKKRFMQEARAASALNHPNIITIHDISTAGGIDFIAMEYVAGKPLAQLIGNKGLPLRETLKYSVQIADALEKAHRAGIVHRDLKPSNIMVTEDGLVKVLDFGLAKLTQAADDADLTKSAESMTQSGAIVGTAAYMSPEQAEGKAVDARSDIFTFGAVLYEMVTGRRAFKGTSHISTPAAILHEEPEPVSRITAGIPQELERIIARCLKKDPERRFQHMDDVKVALEELEEAPPKPRALKRWQWIAAATALLIAVGIWSYLRFFSRGPTLPDPRIVPLTTFPGTEVTPCLSPDGNWVAFVSDYETRENPDIYVKEVDGTGFNRLTTDPAAETTPAWSPDGRQIAFLRHSGGRYTLCLISPLGGEERKLAEYDAWHGLSWSPDGKDIAIACRESSKEPFGIWSLSVKTLEKKRLTSPPGGISGDLFPSFSPDGRHLAFARVYQPVRTALYVVRLPQGNPKLVTEENSPLIPCWTTDSREIVFATNPNSGETALWRVPIDGGEPRRIPTRGTVAQYPSISRTRLAYSTYNPDCDVWRVELTANDSSKLPPKALISSTSWDTNPHFSPDGTRIVFHSLRSGTGEIWVCNSDGTKPVPLTDMKAKSTGSPRWSPDGKRIAFDSTRDGSSDIYLVGAEGGPVRRITAETTEEVVPRWSRDGRWIYFGSNRSGDWQIWKMPSEGGKAIQITRNGGFEGHESADGQYLYYHPYPAQKKGVRRVPSSGGPETLVLEAVHNWGFWDLTVKGIYFIDDSAKPVATISFYDLATRRVKSLAPVHGDPGFFVDNGFSVSPDGKWLLYSGGIPTTSDIMLIENFR